MSRGLPSGASRTMPKSQPPRDKDYRVPAVRRAFTILDSLNQSSTGLTVQEVSRIHTIPYSTAFYLLETMESCGYASRDDESKRYSVGYKLLAIRESARRGRTSTSARSCIAVDGRVDRGHRPDLSSRHAREG